MNPSSNGMVGMVIVLLLVSAYSIFSAICGLIFPIFVVAMIAFLLIAFAGAVFVAYRIVNIAKEKGVIHAIPMFFVFNAILFIAAFIPISGAINGLGDIILPTDTISSAIFTYAHAKFPWVS